MSAYCPKCFSDKVERTTIGYRPGQPNPNTAKCLRCNWKGKERELVATIAGKQIKVYILFYLQPLIEWFKNAWLRTHLHLIRWRNRKLINQKVEYEQMTEGAFSFVPVIDNAIETMFVKQFQHFNLDPTKLETITEHMKVRRRPSSLTWEIDNKPVMQLAWVDTGNNEIVYRLKEISQSRLTLIPGSQPRGKIITSI